MQLEELTNHRSSQAEAVPRAALDKDASPNPSDSDDDDNYDEAMVRAKSSVQRSQAWNSVRTYKERTFNGTAQYRASMQMERGCSSIETAQQKFVDLFRRKEHKPDLQRANTT